MKRKPQKHMIWSNLNLDYEDWREGIEAEYPDISEEDGYDLMCRTNYEYLDDEIVNLNKELDNEIIAICDIGRWNGRFYRPYELESRRISACLEATDLEYGEFYVDELGDFRLNEHHHDGVNHILFREWKDGITDVQKENFISDIESQDVTRREINKYTKKIGPAIAAVYGWRI